MFAGSRLLLPVSTNCVTLVPKPGRKEGHAVREPSLLSGIAVLRRSGSRKWRRPPVAARSGGAGAKEEQVGQKTRCRAPGSRRGGCRPRGSGGVAPFAWRPKPAAIRHVWGGAGNGGLAAGCPRPEEPPPSARRRMSIGPSTKDVQYHRMAPRVSRSAGWGTSGSVSGNRTEISFFFPLSPLSSLSLLILPSPFLSPRLSLPPGTPRPPWRAPPGRGQPAASLLSHLFFFCSSTTATGSHWRSPPLPAARSSQHRDPTQQRGLSDSVSLLPPGLRHQCNAVSRYGKKEAGTGEHLTHLIIK